MELIRVTVKLDDTQVITIAAAVLVAGMKPEEQRHLTPDQAVRLAKAHLHAAKAQADDPLRKMQVKI